MMWWSFGKSTLALVTWCLIELLPVAVIEARPETFQYTPDQVAAIQQYQQQLQQHQFHLNNVSNNANQKQQRLPDGLQADVDYFDKLNVDMQLSNRRFVDLQIKCLIYDGPCDLFGRKAKALLPSVILDNCRLCSQSQKMKLSRVVVHIQQNFPAAWRDALVKFGSSPKFITAGQAAPSVALFGKHTIENETPSFHLGLHPPIYFALPQTTMTVPVLAQPQSAVEAETASLGMERLYESSPAPDLIPAVESPTPPMNPTASPNGYEFTSSAQPPSTPVVESTIEVKPTTIQP